MRFTAKTSLLKCKFKICELPEKVFLPKHKMQSETMHIIYSVNPSVWVLEKHLGDSANSTGKFFFPVPFFSVPEILLGIQF